MTALLTVSPLADPCTLPHTPTPPPPQMQRAPSSELSFRPAAGAFGQRRGAGGAGGAGGSSNALRASGPSSNALASGGPSAEVSRSSTPAPPPPPSLDASALKTSLTNLVEEYHSSKSLEEAVLALGELRTRGADMGAVLGPLLVAALNHR